jgi:aryl-phospho-beta-D-glucosidase BglC (GH1 family)
MENSNWKSEPLTSIVAEKADGTVGMFNLDDCKDIDDIDNSGDSRAVNYVTLAFNQLTDEHIMNYYDDRTFRPDEPVSVADAISIAYNYYYSLMPEPEYVSVKNVGTFNKNIITDELLERETDLPDATNNQLPAWKGVNLQYMATMAGSGEEANYWITEAQIKSMSDMGVNFLRLWISFAAFEGPDYGDRNMVNMYYLEHMDQIVAWCIENDIHIQFSVVNGPGLDRNTFPPELENEITSRIFTDDAYREQFTQWYRMLARRYADIPNKYTSINLLNEPSPLSDENYAETFKPIIAAIWEEAPERVIVADVHMNSTGEAIAKLGVALSSHTYEPQDVMVVSRDKGPAPYINATWPVNAMNGIIFSKSWGSANDNTNGIIIDGNISGTIKIMINDISRGAAILRISADDEIIYEQVPEFVIMGDNQEEDLCYTEEPVTVTIPDGTKEISLNCPDGALTFSNIVIERNDGTIVLIPFTNNRNFGPAPDRITIKDDGTFFSEGTSIDAEMIINTAFGFPAIIDTKNIADQYGVGFMVGEVGMYGDYFLDFYVPDETVMAYHQDILTTLDNYDIPWVTGWLIDRYGPVTTYPYYEDREYRKIDGAEIYYIDVKMFDMFKEIFENDN